MKKIIFGITQVINFIGVHMILSILISLVMGLLGAFVTWLTSVSRFLAEATALMFGFTGSIYIVAAIAVGSLVVYFMGLIYKKVYIVEWAYVGIIMYLGYEVITKTIDNAGYYGFFNWNFVNWTVYYLIMSGIIIVSLFAKTIFATIKEKAEEGENKKAEAMLPYEESNELAKSIICAFVSIVLFILVPFFLT